MVEHVIRCDECGCKNGVPEAFLLEARCRRCENPLTMYTRFRSFTRSRIVGRAMQAAGGIAILVMMFGSDVAEWWESEPFRLTEAQVSAVTVEPKLPPTSLAFDE